jgi:peptidoglycan lytic transglycosylase
MTPTSKLRASPRAPGAVALFAATITAATPLAAMAAGVGSSTATAPPALSDPTPTYREPFTVSGQAAVRYAHGLARMEFAAPGEGWQPVRTATVDSQGRYRFRLALIRSGAIRVVVRERPRAVQAAVSDEQVTSARPVTVGAALVVTRSRLEVMAGSTASVSGFIRPSAAGRVIRLERRVGGAWRAVATSRTGERGAYRLAYRINRAGSAPVRLSVAGDAANPPTARTLGRTGTLRPAIASRYDLYGGPLACGGRLGYDSLVVAHRSLPCGTRVTIHYHGRTVEARVQDRGPFVGGREFDLAGGVARRLGFDGVGRIWVSV